MSEFASRFTGFEHDPWTEYRFDQFVHTFGNWAEVKSSQLHERTGKPIHPLSRLLADPIHNPDLHLLEKAATDGDGQPMGGIWVG